MQQINTSVTGMLADAGYPPLTDGKILYGRSEQFSQSAPSRIIFTRTSSNFVYGTRNVYSRSTQAYGSERREQNASRAIAQESVNFEVRCWGADPSRDLVANDDITRALYQAVIASIHLIAVGSYAIGDGVHTNSTFASSQIMLEGTEFVFPVTLLTPVLDKLIPYDPERAYAPSGVTYNIQDYITTPLGTDTGCEGN